MVVKEKLRQSGKWIFRTYIAVDENLRALCIIFVVTIILCNNIM